MKNAHPIRALALAVALAAIPLAHAQTNAEAPVAGKQADNTKTNKRDQSSATTKPTDQPNNRADIKLAAAVRRAVVKDKSVSTMGHNVKIVVASGVATLRGPVHDDAEKAKIAEIAGGVTGVTSVQNELDVKH